MKIIIRIIPFLIFSLLSSGCSVIYTTAVDQRDVKTILNDTTIKFTIVNKFYDDEAINSLNLSSGCYRGHVYLVGEYDKAFQKKRAIKIAPRSRLLGALDNERDGVSSVCPPLEGFPERHTKIDKSL